MIFFQSATFSKKLNKIAGNLPWGSWAGTIGTSHWEPPLGATSGVWGLHLRWKILFIDLRVVFRLTLLLDVDVVVFSFWALHSLVLNKALLCAFFPLLKQKKAVIAAFRQIITYI
jgi:hypothetical protein